MIVVPSLPLPESKNFGVLPPSNLTSVRRSQLAKNLTATMQHMIRFITLSPLESYGTPIIIRTHQGKPRMKSSPCFILSFHRHQNGVRLEILTLLRLRPTPLIVIALG